MKDKTMSIDTLIVICGTISGLFEMGVYYFSGSGLATVIISVFLAFTLAKLFLEMSLSHQTIFYISTLLTGISLLFAGIVFIIQPNTYVTFSPYLILNVVVNWSVPVLYSTIYSMVDRGSRMHDYESAFRRASYVFVAIYAISLLDVFFIHPVIPCYKEMEFGAHNFVPMMEWAQQMENTIRNEKSVYELLVYLATCVCMGIPIGFYVRIVLDELHAVLRTIAFLIIPLVLEGMQSLTGRGRGNIDDYFMMIVGILIGVAAYHLLNFAFEIVANHKFLENRNKQSGQLWM